jgi:RNA 2',3'-cyclic 3'-phosphodiesterase
LAAETSRKKGPKRSSGIRCFVALEAGIGVGAALRDAAGTLPFGGIRWVPAHQLHFTLKFLGEVPDDRIAAARDEAARAAAGVSPFDLALEGLGAFPAAGPPRVVWAGCGAGREELVALAKAVEAAFAEALFSPEPRPFSPHLTLGRVKDPRAIQARPFRDALARGVAAKFGTIAAREIVLFRSDLSSAGPTYTALSRHALSVR